MTTNESDLPAMALRVLTARNRLNIASVAADPAELATSTELVNAETTILVTQGAEKYLWYVIRAEHHADLLVGGTPDDADQLDPAVLRALLQQEGPEVDE